MSNDVTPRDRVWIAILRAHRQRGGEFRRGDVLAFADDVGATTVTDTLRAGAEHEPPVLERRSDPDDGRRNLWSLRLDDEQAEIPVSERFIETGED